MISDARFEQFFDDVTELRVAVARVETKVRALPDADRRLARDITYLRRQVTTLQRWRWQAIGAAAAVAAIAAPLTQILLSLGGHS